MSHDTNGKTVLITGATGMIGNLVLEHCLQSQEILHVTSLLRRPSGISHQKLREVIIEDFLYLDEDSDYWESVDIVYYCLGVYTGAVNRELFRTITVDYPETLANVLIKKNPDLTFCLLSGAGADRNEKSRMMFAEDKGAVENQLSGMGFKAFYVFRPGYIFPVSQREEPNVSYRMMRFLYPVIKLLGKNSSVTSTQLAASMFWVGLNGNDLEIIENRDIIEVYQAGLEAQKS
jgi:uncharacterized protein YbjT (DUF2867 family)